VTDPKETDDARRWSVARHRVSIWGKVIDEVTRKPIAGAEVRLVRVPGKFKRKLDLLAMHNGAEWEKRNHRPDRTFSRADGLFYFLDLPDGEYEIRAALPNCGKRYGETSKKKEVSESEGTRLNTLQAMWVSLMLPPTGIRGKVIDAAKKTGLLMAEVRLRGSGERTFTDGQGVFMLGPIEASERSERTLECIAQGYKRKEKAQIVGPKGGQLLDLGEVRMDALPRA